MAVAVRTWPALRASIRYLAIVAAALAVFAAILLMAGKDPLKAYADTFQLHPRERLRLLGAAGPHDPAAPGRGRGGPPRAPRPHQRRRRRPAVHGRLGRVGRRRSCSPACRRGSSCPSSRSSASRAARCGPQSQGSCEPPELVNETIATLLLNYVAPLIVSFFIFGPWRCAESSAYPQSSAFPEAARLPSFFKTRIHAGLLIALAALLVVLAARGEDPLGSRDAGHRRQPGGGATPGHPGGGVYRHRPGHRRWSGGLAGMGEVIGDSRPPAPGPLAGLRLHGLSHRLARRREAGRDPPHGLPLRGHHLGGRHPADHAGPAVLGGQHPPGHDPLRRARPRGPRGAGAR